MAAISDFRTADGSIDWKAYDAACISEGDRCYQCRSLIFDFSSRRSPGRRLCHDCDNLIHGRSEATHETLARCPHCSHAFPAAEHGAWDAATRGNEDCRMCCPSCDQSFTVQVRLILSVTSPDVIEKPPEEPEDDDDDQ